MQPQHNVVATRIKPPLIMVTLAAVLAVILAPSNAFAGTIFLDPGHGGRYPGATYSGVEEQRVNLLIALETRKVLQSRGHTVHMSRTGDYMVTNADIPTWHYSEANDSYGLYSDKKTGAYPIPYDDLQARCDKANVSGSDIFISIHNNAGGNATGTETYYNSWDTPTDTKLSRTLATYLQSGVTSSAGTVSRGVNDVGYYVIKWANMPSALIEVAFLSNSSDRAKLLSSTFRHKVAVGIADGIDRYYATNPLSPIEPRIEGADRYATSAAAALTGWPSGSDSVILASGEDWADALAASPLSTHLDAPVLLTSMSELQPSTAAAITKLGPEHIIVLGSEASVATSVVDAACVAADIPAEEVERLAGVDRYETAVAVAERMGLKPGAGVTVVAGTAFPDATSASSFSAMRGMPILLTRTDGLAKPTAAYIARHSEEVTRVSVVGGPPTVSQNVVDELKARSLSVTWLKGADRYQTNVATLRQYWGAKTMSPYVATAQTFPDALTAGALAGRKGQPVVLCGRTVLAGKTREWVMLNTKKISSFTMVGGTGTLSNLLEWELAKARRVPAP